MNTKFCFLALISILLVPGMLFAGTLIYKVNSYKATSTHKALYKENGDVVYEETTKYYMNSDGLAKAEEAFTNEKAGATAYDKNATITNADSNLSEISAAK